jgi:hypothetical protein
MRFYRGECEQPTGKHRRLSQNETREAMWSLRGNTWNLSEDRQEQRKNLCRQYTKLIGAAP